MTNPERPRDPNQLAKFIVDVATGEIEVLEPKLVNEAQSRGGKAGGKARAESLTAERRSEIARLAATIRYAKKDE